MQSEAAGRTGEYRLGQWVTLVVYENNLPRRIYTDGRGFDAEDNVPSFDRQVARLRLQRDAAAFSFDPWTPMDLPPLTLCSYFVLIGG